MIHNEYMYTDFQCYVQYLCSCYLMCDILCPEIYAEGPMSPTVPFDVAIAKLCKRIHCLNLPFWFWANSHYSYRALRCCR